MRGFWSDPDGWSLAEVVVICVLPVWMYVAIKMALAKELSVNQVDYFSVLSYPLLVAVGGKMLTYLPLPWSRRSRFEPVSQYQPTSAPMQPADIAPEPLDPSKPI